MSNTHTISLFVSNKPGVLLRITMIFARRGFNIESLVVSSALDGKFSRMTITAQGSPKALEQILKQANKLIDVVHVSEHRGDNSAEIELALIKIKVLADKRTELLQLIDHYQAKTVDLRQASIIIQVTETTEKMNAMLEVLSPFGIMECVRTGKILMALGDEET